MEAELGIDSIKRVEILGTLQQAYFTAEAQTFGEDQMPQIAGVKTLRDIIEWLSETLSSSGINKQPGPQTAALPQSASVPETAIEDLQEKVLQVVSDRTGYPADMLELDLNMEAELGIDSIKRVEILGTLQQAYFTAEAQTFGEDQMPQTAGIKTLQDIIDWLKNALDGKNDDNGGQTVDVDVAETTEREVRMESDSEIPRFCLASVEAPIQKNRSLNNQVAGTILITDDGGGVAENLADKLDSREISTVLISKGTSVKETGKGKYTADFEDPVAINQLIDLLHGQGKTISGFIHLAALMKGLPFEELDFSKWKKRLQLEVKSLYYFARFAGEDIRKASQTGNAWLMAATALGGNFAVGREKQDISNPWQGGIAGFIKTAAIEWPEVQCKVLDFEVELNTIDTADRILLEMQCDDRTVEIGYQGDRRYALKLLDAPLDRIIDGGLSIDSSWVVVATGGARGITAEVVLELAKRYRPNIVLAGRSPFIKEREDVETAGNESGEALKKALIEKHRRSGKKISPAKIESEFQQLMKQREIQKNIDLIDQSGARVNYIPVDVCDDKAFGEFIDEIYGTFGRIDLFIHGAGVIEDKLIEDKTPDSFDRVFDTKADSVFMLSRKLDAESLKGLVLFSSVSGRFGARGQNDYAAASEVMNKLAVYLNNNWPGRVLAINWGPWSGAGMVSPEVKRQFEKNGVQLIPAEAGKQIFDHELRYGRKGDAEIIIGGGAWQVRPQSLSVVKEDIFPLLRGATTDSESNGIIRTTRELSLIFDRYLKDHRLDGKPVFPAAMAMELMAEVVNREFPEMEIINVKNFKVLKGIVLENDSRSINVNARPKVDSSEDLSEIDVEINISAADKPETPCYQAAVKLSNTIPPPVPVNLEAFSDITPFSMTVEEAYKHWLFHGPSMQGVVKIGGINKNGIYSELRHSVPSECLTKEVKGQWIVDPVLIDSAFQLAILWERAHFDMTPLPSRFAEYHRYCTSFRSPIRCYLEAKTHANGQILLTDIYFCDSNDRMVAALKEMEFSCSKVLNRLA
jgi:NAD(P)-dependent dehydrogenase (short-subunit alcohol dehydrogenase family)/acyl carrier protein